MKTVLAIAALMVSSFGIATSLMREEMRCYLGLSSPPCAITEQPTQPSSSLNNIKEISEKTLRPIILPENIRESILNPQNNPMLPEKKNSIPKEAESFTPSDEIPVESVGIIKSDKNENEEIPHPVSEGIPLEVIPFDNPEQSP